MRMITLILSFCFTAATGAIFENTCPLPWKPICVVTPLSELNLLKKILYCSQLGAVYVWDTGFCERYDDNCGVEWTGQCYIEIHVESEGQTYCAEQNAEYIHLEDRADQCRFAGEFGDGTEAWGGGSFP